MHEVQHQSVKDPLFTKEGGGGVLFGAAWRLTILLLPWQTRWFADASLGGWPWEQGRLSVYASMIVLVAAIVLDPKFLPKKSDAQRMLLGIIFIILTLLTTQSLPATAQWWIEVVLLACFVRSLWQNSITPRAIAPWFVASMIPHACLGIWQYLIGDVVAMKWLGIAAHEAAGLGTSVVEHGDVRILRAYGGFPHPNIFGGWLVSAILVTFISVGFSSSKWRALTWSLSGALCSVALLVTYARSVWIAAAIGFCALVLVLKKHVSSFEFSKQFFILAVCMSVALSGAVLFSQRDHVFARLDPSLRLEQKSIDTRKESLVNGWKTFLQYPVFGTGPNAELVPMRSSCKEKCLVPLEPPHAVPLIVLADFGIVGAVLLLYAFFRARSAVTCFMLNAPCLITLGVLSLFDHYPWSTWSGMCLVACVILLSIQPRPSS